MTFCFIFCARHRGGIGIVCDRRISIETKFDGWVPINDDAVKFGLINDNLGFIYAGSIDLINSILDRLVQLPRQRKPSERLSEAAKNIAKIYDELIQADPRFRDPQCGAEFVLFDTIRNRSSQKFRLLQLSVSYSASENRSVVKQNYDRGKDWVAIGTSQRIRRQLAACAIMDMQEYSRRKVRVRRLTKKEIERIPPAKQGNADAALTTIEPGNNPPWRELETYRMLKEFGDTRIDYTSILTAVASNAIHYEVKHLKNIGFEEMQTISEKQYTAVFHPAYRLRASTPGFPE